MVGALGLGLVGGPAATAYAAPSHPIVVIVLENKTYGNITSKNKAAAPYLNGTLIPTGRLFTNYTATTSGSVKDYHALTSGLIDLTASRRSDNIFNQLQGLSDAGVTWGEFEEGMPSTCYTGPNVTPYMKGHNPAVSYKDITADPAICNADVVSYSSFDAAHLRSFSFVVPNEFNDMHTGPNAATQIRTGDTWLAHNVPAMLNAGAEVIITFDEGVSGNEHVVTLEVGAGVPAGTTDASAFGHYSLLAGLQDAYGVPRLHGATGVNPLPI
jgi:phosphatidylinositol-3-phosphatase